MNLTDLQWRFLKTRVTFSTLVFFLFGHPLPLAAFMEFVWRTGVHSKSKLIGEC